MGLSQGRQPLSEPAMTASQVKYSRTIHSQILDEAENLFSASFRPIVQNLSLFRMLPVPIPKLALIFDGR